jgi:phosphoserine phosphatase
MPQLLAPGWNDQARHTIQQLIRAGSGQQLPVVFDFDNTLVCGDIGEAVLAVLARSGKLTPASGIEPLCPEVRLPGRGKLTLRSCANILEYYEALLSPTAHGQEDPTPLATGYIWATEILAGMSLAEVTEATRTAFEQSTYPNPYVEVPPGHTAYPAPRFYAEMVELVTELLRHRFDVWVVSASNVWSVRWMVLNGLNPLLKAAGSQHVIPPDRVVGVSTLLTDRQGRWYKDSVLARSDRRYAAMEAASLRRFTLTRHPQYPVPVYSGKVACIYDALGRNPYLCAGDSPSDHPMLAISQHRLWIARHSKAAYQKKAAAFMRQTDASRWICQWVLDAPVGRFTSGPSLPLDKK